MGLNTMSIQELREEWAKIWGKQPHAHIGRKMLERSLQYKQREQTGQGLTTEQKQHLNKLVSLYKRDPLYFDEGRNALKPGTRFIRQWKGEEHVVTVTANGFMYDGREYASLTAIAGQITGSHWNGWVFFGLKK